MSRPAFAIRGTPRRLLSHCSPRIIPGEARRACRPSCVASAQDARRDDIEMGEKRPLPGRGFVFFTKIWTEVGRDREERFLFLAGRGSLDHVLGALRKFKLVASYRRGPRVPRLGGRGRVYRERKGRRWASEGGRVRRKRAIPTADKTDGSPLCQLCRFLRCVISDNRPSPDLGAHPSRYHHQFDVRFLQVPFRSFTRGENVAVGPERFPDRRLDHFEIDAIRETNHLLNFRGLIGRLEPPRGHTQVALGRTRVVRAEQIEIQVWSIMAPPITVGNLGALSASRIDPGQCAVTWARLMWPYAGRLKTTTFSTAPPPQWRAHASINSRRRASASDRRYACSALSPMTCAKACSAISRGKCVSLPAQSRKALRKPCTVAPRSFASPWRRGARRSIPRPRCAGR
jgi:hypothetical protein